MPGRRSPAVEVSPLYQAIGAAIKQARKELGLSQEDLAKIVQLTRTSITNLESGKQQVPLHTLYDIAAAIDHDVRELLPVDVPEPTAPAYGAEDVDRWANQLKKTSRRVSA
jgi:transcriptional regulator with XRE-family HTH domain